MVSDKMDKTVVVAVEDRVKHRLYGKVLRQTSRMKAHDESNSAGVGDRVRIMETRPLSATKRWRLHRDPREGQVIETLGGPPPSSLAGAPPQTPREVPTQFRKARETGNR